MLVYLILFFTVCFFLVLIIIHTAPEYIEDEEGKLWSKKDYENFKNQQKKSKQPNNPIRWKDKLYRVHAQ